jgi:predicted component of type VI protein secretion system
MQLFIFRLFHADRPFEEVEARTLTEGRLIIGRSEVADWALPDSRRTLSRVHCVLALNDRKLLLQDRSTNGVFIDGGARAPSNENIELTPPQTLRLGAFLITIEAEPLSAQSVVDPVLDSKPQHGLQPAFRQGGSLIEAFCEGADLDASALSGEDPVELMRRAGAIYRQTVAGLSHLMLERARTKEDYRLDRTAIGAVENNPFKWTSPRKLSEDLLKSGRDGFLPEAKAVEASFEDLNRHMIATTEAARVVCQLALSALAPEAIAAEAPAQGSLLKGRSAACWEIHNKRHAQLAADGSTDGSLKLAFAQTYRQMLDRSTS